MLCSLENNYFGATLHKSEIQNCNIKINLAVFYQPGGKNGEEPEKTPETIGNIKLIFCLAFHGKKSNARCAKIILFWGKKSMREKEFSVYLIKLSWKRFFMKEFKWKIFTNRNFADFAIKTLCISFSNSYWIKTNTAGRQLLNVHNYTLSFLLFTFLD